MFDPPPIAITDDFLVAIPGVGRDVQRLRDFKWTLACADSESQLPRLLQHLRDWFTRHFDAALHPEFKDSQEADDERVTSSEDPNRPFTYDIQRTG